MLNVSTATSTTPSPPHLSVYPYFVLPSLLLQCHSMHNVELREE